MWDPRPAGLAAQSPIAGAVNIPLAELPARIHELPPRGEQIFVVGIEPWAGEATRQIESLGRRVVPTDDWAFAPEPAPARGRLWRPNGFLAQVLGSLSSGRALDLGCGTGRDAVYMASLGWRVTAVDRLPDALDRARALASRYADAIVPIEWCVLDLKRGELPARWTAAFDLVAILRYFDRPLFRRAVAWLRPGGSLVAEVFTTLHRPGRGRPAHRRAFAEPGELRALVPGLRIVRHEESARLEEHTARMWAVRAAAGGLARG